MKSKTVKMVSAVAVLGVLSGAYVGVKSYVESQEEKEAEEEEAESISLVDVESDDVASVDFVSDEENVTLEKEDDSWVKKDETEFPLSQDTVDSAVSGVVSLETDQQLDDVDDLSEYDLDEPQNQITITTEDGEETVLRVGLESDSKYYVLKDDDDSTVYLVSSSSIEPFMGSLYDFAESGTFPSVTFSTITSVKVDKEDGYELTEDEDTLYWNVTDGTNTEKADSTKSNSITSAISSLSYSDFVDYNCTDDSKYGFDDPYAVITVNYTVEEEVEADSSDEEETDSSEEEETETDSDESEDTEDNTSAEETETEDADSTDTSEEDTDLEDADSTDSSEEDTDSEEEETETVEVDKTLTIYIGDETDSARYVKVDDSKEVYTISESSLTDILDICMSDLYNLTVNYISVQNLDAMKIESADGSHTVNIVREITTDDDGEESTTTSYTLDGEELDESTFDTFYNKINNMVAQERLTEEYTPEGDAAYTFTFADVNGNNTVVKYYEYDTNFYAAVVDDRVYLVNKMNVRDAETTYQEMLGTDSEEEVSATPTEEAEEE